MAQLDAELFGHSAARARRYLAPKTILLPARGVQEDSPLLVSNQSLLSSALLPLTLTIFTHRLILFQCLPREVQEIIMNYLDGLSLVRLSRTCASFFNFVIEVVRPYTYKHCSSKILRKRVSHF